MTRAEPGAAVTVKELVERHVVAPLRVVLEVLVAAEHRAPPRVVAGATQRGEDNTPNRDLNRNGR